MFSIFQPLFLQNTKAMYIWNWDLNLNLGPKDLAFVCPGFHSYGLELFHQVGHLNGYIYNKICET